jgi:hypothetical protein
MQGLSPSDIFGINRARAAAKSTNLNPRNLGYLWYHFWTRAASRLACNVDGERCIVAPQFPLWRIWTRDDMQLGNITMVSEGHEMYVEDHIATDPIDYDDDDDPDNDSIEAGTISTIDETLSVKTRSRITDFALIYWLENNIVNPDKDDEDDIFYRPGVYCSID